MYRHLLSRFPVRVLWLSLAAALFLCIPRPARADADLRLFMQVDHTSVVEGSQVDYGLSVENFGPTAAADVAVTVQLPAGAALVSVTLKPPAQGVCTVTVVQGPGPPAPPVSFPSVGCSLGTMAEPLPPASFVLIKLDLLVQMPSSAAPVPFRSTASVTSSTPDPNGANNTANADVTIFPLAMSADLAVTASGAPNPVQVDSRVTYTVTVINNGPGQASNVMLDYGVSPLTLSSFQSANASQGFCHTELNTCGGFGCFSVLSDPLEGTCELGSMSPGATATVTIAVGASSSRTTDVGKTKLSAAAGVSADEPDTNANNDHVGVETQIVLSAPSSGGGGGGGCTTGRAAQPADASLPLLLLAALALCRGRPVRSARRHRPEKQRPALPGQGTIPDA